MAVALPETDLQRLLTAEPDLVDRIFDYVLELMPEIRSQDRSIDAVKQAVRGEFQGIETYIKKRRGAGSALDPAVAQQVLVLFNGRNASEVARRLNIGRATVYRVIKQAGTK
jgi:DNA invertase Pin-like site-specific DNA recombinase